MKQTYLMMIFRDQGVRDCEAGSWWVREAGYSHKNGRGKSIKKLQRMLV